MYSSAVYDCMLNSNSDTYDRLYGDVRGNGGADTDGARE
jgi:hypothetical protein